MKSHKDIDKGKSYDSSCMILECSYVFSTLFLKVMDPPQLSLKFFLGCIRLKGIESYCAQLQSHGSRVILFNEWGLKTLH